MKRVLLFAMAAAPVAAADPGPTQAVSVDGNPYHAAVPAEPDNHGFPPAERYGAAHDGSSLALVFPFSSLFGSVDHSRGQFVYSMAPFHPRGSEGVFGFDLWLEQQDASGAWVPAAANAGTCDLGVGYQPVNTPNPGPSPAYSFRWTYDASRLPPHTAFRVFVYVYVYNQGGAGQGDFPVFSATTPVDSGPGNDPPRIRWSPSVGSQMPAQSPAGRPYTISADAEDDNGNLASVSIERNGQPFADAGGGSGFLGNSRNTASDSTGTVSYTAWALDSFGERSETITWAVDLNRLDQPPIGSADAVLPFGQPFTAAYVGGSGSGPWQFVVEGFTNWDGGASENHGTLVPEAGWTDRWLPPAPGFYSFWVAHGGDVAYGPSAAAGPYTLSVTKCAQPDARSTDATIVFGQSFAPEAIGGAGAGPWQFVVAGWTNWDGAASAHAGTQTLSGAWISPWIPPAAGSYAFWVAHGGDSATQASPPAGPYMLTVARADQAPVSASPQTASISPGQPLVLTADGGSGTGAYGWTGAAAATGSQLTVAFASPGTYSVALVRAGDMNFRDSAAAAATITVIAGAAQFVAFPTSFTYTGALQGPVVSALPAGTAFTVAGTAAAVNAGSYALTATAAGAAVGSSTIPWRISPASQAPVLIDPPYASASAGDRLAFTASGGSGTGVMQWAGAAAGSGDSASVVFPTAGTFTVSAMRVGDANFLGSDPAVATIAVGAGPPPAVPLPVVPQPASPPVVPPITAPPARGPAGGWSPAPVPKTSTVRVRFNAAGRDFRVTGPNGTAGASVLWTDPLGLQRSSWPAFDRPREGSVLQAPVALPRVPEVSAEPR